MTPLHIHSNYSFLRGTCTIPQLLEKASEYKLKALPLTDTDGMHGVINFFKAASEKGIKPIAGAQITNPHNSENYVIVLARNKAGYSQLCKIITSRKLNENFTLDTVFRGNTEDLFFITYDFNLLQKFRHYKNLYPEIIPFRKFRSRNLQLLSQFGEKGIVLSPPVYFVERGDYELHKTVSAIRERQTIANIPAEMLVEEQYYFHNPRDLEKKIPDEILRLDVSEIIADNCETDLELGKYKFPEYAFTGGEPSTSLLMRLCYEGLIRRYRKPSTQLTDRLHYELEVIRELNFTDYFLVVWDIVREAKNRGMMIIGRGSAANSLVSYCLGFTEVDPIKYDLYFERFLNRSRKSPPDVDLDFSWKERDEIVRYVFEKYGYDRVAMISTTVTFRARSAFREVAKAFGYSDREISKFSKFIPWTNAINLPNLTKMFPESRHLPFDKEPWKSIIDIASRIASFPRHLSIHPGGIVIAPRQITEYVALEFAKNKGLGLIVTQPDMYGVEDLGLVKIDLLSQRSLGVLRDTMEKIRHKR